MKKLILLSERLPFPPTSGTKNLLYNYCKILNKDLDIEVVNVSFLEKEDDVSLKPEFISKVYELPNADGKVKLINLIYRTFIKREYPMQVSLFWDPKVKKEVDRIINIEKPDYVIADLVRTSEYLKDYNGYKIVDFQDLFSLRYERQVCMDLSTLNPYGAYLFRLPLFVQKVLSKEFVKRIVMNSEIKLLRKYEINIGKCYNRVMFVAKNEGKLYDKMVKANKSLIVPLGVDFNYFSEDLAIKKTPKSITFMGALNVAHNENGIVNFCRNVFPIIKRKVPQAKIYIIGGGATDVIKSLAETDSNIILMGRVDDVRVAISACEVFICPLRFGSGIKTKNLEAMSMGMPIVTTTIGAENIDAANGKEWFIEDNDIKYAERICQLFENDALRIQMGEAGKKFVKENFSWNTARKAFEEVLR